MPTDEAKGWLTEIKGVGPKTASVVLNFHFGNQRWLSTPTSSGSPSGSG